MSQVKLTPSKLEFRAKQFNEKLTRSITVISGLPNIVSEGWWEVAPHESDPPHAPDFHPWISFESTQFESNLAFLITVDTSHLIADKVYERQILLHINSVPDPDSVTIRVETVTIKTQNLLYVILVLLFVMSVLTGVDIGNKEVAIAGAVILVGLMCWAVAATVAVMGVVVNPILGILAGFIVAAVAGALLNALGVNDFLVLTSPAEGLRLGVFLYLMTDGVVNNLTKIGVKKGFSIRLMLLTTAFGMTLGISFLLPLLAVDKKLYSGLFNPFTLLVMVGTGLPLAASIVGVFLKQRQFISKYRQLSRRLIQS